MLFEGHVRWLSH